MFFQFPGKLKHSDTMLTKPKKKSSNTLDKFDTKQNCYLNLYIYNMLIDII